MKFEPGTIIVIGAVLLFYLRLILLQFGRVRQARLKVGAAAKKKKKKSSTGPSSVPNSIQLSVRVSNWYLAGAGIVLMILGAVMGASSWLEPNIQALWWIPVTLGILFFTITFK